MQWLKGDRLNLKPSIAFDLTKPKNRLKLLEENNYTCRYCGGRYNKFLYCSANVVYCKLCYIVTHINTTFEPGVQVIVSSLSQVDIIRRTINYVITNGKLPALHKIDAHASLANISILELSNLLISKLRFDTDYKIFFNSEFNISFMNSFLLETPLFIDEDSEEYEYINKEEYIKIDTVSDNSVINLLYGRSSSALLKIVSENQWQLHIESLNFQMINRRFLDADTTS